MTDPPHVDEDSVHLPWIPGAEAVRLVGAGQAVLVDLRSAREVAATGTAAGAVHIPLSEFTAAATPGDPAFLPALTDGRPVVLYCATGVRSQIAGGYLMGQGHRNVWNLGGLREWIEGGGALHGGLTYSRS